MTGSDTRRGLPRTDAVLADERLRVLCDLVGRDRVKRGVVDELDRWRAAPSEPLPDAAAIALAVINRLPRVATGLRSVINATGVVLHTNLGRAAMSAAAVGAMTAAAGYVDVEFDLTEGTRAARGRQALAALHAAVPDAGGVLVVNNGAAAVLLAATVFSAGREIILSRGELVEIGDGFRLPDLLTTTGARLREVGTTNRVTIADYAAAVGPDTGCILKVHPSNFRITGFTRSVEVHDLTRLAVPVLADVGSGLLTPSPDLPDEPDVSTALRAGADVVTCSGDKLLGGPQAGLLFGRSHHIRQIARHPLARAMRIDKLRLAALEATLDGPPTPSAAALTADPDELRRRCESLARALAGVECAVVPSDGVVGGGGAPGVTLPGWALAIAAQFAGPLRLGTPPVVARVDHGRCLLDLRCVEPDDDETIAAAIRAAGLILAKATGR
ncbi:MAG: L-seryl-tRNA(Sec) selenium transferase [Actinomycetota bacterium]|nr:L-seryl-tRNA(Sec) selenium transferase [Actinomycetota bacterium]